MTPVIARDVPELDAVLTGLRGRTVALVPTMGALHDGHRSLLREARERADIVAVSVFVNPLQFGPGEDLDRYPRTFATDMQICAEDGVDLVFAPTRAVMYPRPQRVTVNAGELATTFEGEVRPGHFDGVLTVVLKLFLLVRPDVGVFGQKDAQQLALIQQMTEDLNLPIRIVGCPIVREPDGIAMSSRNRYLSSEERVTARALSRALRAAGKMSYAGPASVLRAARQILNEAEQAEPPLEVDYLTLVDPVNFKELKAGGTAVLAVAGRVGSTRLIDNLRLEVGHDDPFRRGTGVKGATSGL